MYIVQQIIEIIEAIAPTAYQENYDNAGLITGQKQQTTNGVMLSLDVTEEVIEEAIANNCNLIIAHHPIIFKGLKKINGNNYIERAIIKAIKYDIAIYAAHTNLDNVLKHGVNEKLAKILGLSNISILQPKDDVLCKLAIYVPNQYLDNVKSAIFMAGAGSIGNYSECSFSSNGQGSFKPNSDANPALGIADKLQIVEEIKIEVIIPSYLSEKIIQAAKNAHPYEVMAYDLFLLKNKNSEIGAGAVGFLPNEMEVNDFLIHVKEKLNLKVIKHTQYAKTIKKVAVCGGVGSFLIGKALAVQSDAYITADLKYHEYFEAENSLLLCDVGHYESEIYTLDIFYNLIKEKFPTFAVVFCKKNTNPIQYFI